MNQSLIAHFDEVLRLVDILIAEAVAELPEEKPIICGRDLGDEQPEARQ